FFILRPEDRRRPVLGFEAIRFEDRAVGVYRFGHGLALQIIELIEQITQIGAEQFAFDRINQIALARRTLSGRQQIEQLFQVINRANVQRVTHGGDPWFFLSSARHAPIPFPNYFSEPFLNCASSFRLYSSSVSSVFCNSSWGF